MPKSVNEYKNEQKNLLLAMLLIIVLLFGIDFLFPSDKQGDISVQMNPPHLALSGSDAAVSEVPAAVSAQADMSAHETVETAVAALQNDYLIGALNTATGGLVSLELTQYKNTTQPDSGNVMLLKPNEYWTALKWVGQGVHLPDQTQAWRSTQDKLTPYSPLTLTFSNEDVKIERKISMDDAYMFTMTDTLTNLKSEPISLSLQGQINRRVAEDSFNVSPVHEGFLSMVSGKLVEKKYDDVQTQGFTDKTAGGWVGITDKYWQTVLIFDQQTPDVSVGFNHQGDLYTASFNTPFVSVPAGGTLKRTTHMFAGAKVLDLINAYEKNLNIPKFDYSIDFGWFYFLTKPFLHFLNWLYAMVGNMGVAILIFATLLRIVMLPIATKSYESMAKMRKVQPKLKMLQERYKNNRMMLQQETMNLYKREKINPAGGCLPLLIQIPVFYALYKVLSVSINMRQAPFFGWIHDLSMPDPSSVFTAFGYLDWPIPTILNIGVWPVLMGITMWVQQKLNPAPVDKTQANMFKWMPIIFTFMLGNFAAGLVIYWTWSNVLSIAQQKYIIKKVGA
ncbi:MAG: membrane protein insertase YidC [Alphaproteobacteria bacterium]